MRKIIHASVVFYLLFTLLKNLSMITKRSEGNFLLTLWCKGRMTGWVDKGKGRQGRILGDVTMELIYW